MGMFRALVSLVTEKDSLNILYHTNISALLQLGKYSAHFLIHVGGIIFVETRSH